MASTETVTAKSVDGPNSNGWYDIELEDGRKTATKEEAVAQAAFAALGESKEAVIGTSVKGNFTNHYLNQFDGVGELKPVRRASGGAPRASGGGATKDPAVQERIARQWAYGRSIELLIAAGGPTLFPLPPEEMSNLSTQAQALLEATKK